MHSDISSLCGDTITKHFSITRVRVAYSQNQANAKVQEMFNNGLFFFLLLFKWGIEKWGWEGGGGWLKQRSALLTPGGDELQRPRRALDCGYLVFPHRLTAGQLFRESFDTLRYLSLFIGCRKNCSLVASGYHHSPSASREAFRFQTNCIFALKEKGKCVLDRASG